MTAEVFFQRLREAQAKTEDFDEVVEEFGRGCPCKDPPLKSKGKTHLRSQTHDKAFNKPGGVYLGMSVRAAFEASAQRADAPLVLHVSGSQRIGEDDADEIENGGMYDDDQYDEMERLEEGAEFEVVSRVVNIIDDDDNVDDIQVQD